MRTIYTLNAKQCVICNHKTWTWWLHQMGTFSALLALWIFRVTGPVNSPHKGQWREALVLSLISAWTNGLVNHRDAGDLRRHRAHYDNTVMEAGTSVDVQSGNVKMEVRLTSILGANLRSTISCRVRRSRAKSNVMLSSIITVWEYTNTWLDKNKRGAINRPCRHHVVSLNLVNIGLLTDGTNPLLQWSIFIHEVLWYSHYGTVLFNLDKSRPKHYCICHNYK